MSAFGQQFDRLLHQFPQVEVEFCQGQLAHLDLREVQNVVDDREERISIGPVCSSRADAYAGKVAVLALRELRPRRAGGTKARKPPLGPCFCAV